MNRSEMRTVIKLLFFSFRLTFATTHPSMQDKVRTNTEISRTYRTDDSSMPSENPVLHI